MNPEGTQSQQFTPVPRNNGTSAVTARLDSRGRINLKPFAPVSESYRVEIDAEGRMLLTPLQIMTVAEARELRQLRDAKAAAAAAATAAAYDDGHE